MRHDALQAQFGDPASDSSGTAEPRIACPADDSEVLAWARLGLSLKRRIEEQR